MTPPATRPPSPGSWALMAIVARIGEPDLVDHGDAPCHAPLRSGQRRPPHRPSRQRIREAVRAAAEWTNALLQPPQPHVIGLFVAAAQNRAIADAFVTNFDHTDRQWAVLSSPEATAAFIASSGAVAG